MERIKVAVSPFFGGEEWVDEKSGIKFEKSKHGLNTYSIPANLDLSGIKKSIRLNNLILVEGDLGLFNTIDKEVVIEAPKEEPVVVDEPVAEVEEVVEEPKKKSSKKKTK